MKKLIVIIIMLLPMIAGAQTKTTHTKAMSFCGVPFGISVEEFKQRVCTEALKDSLASLVGAKRCIIYSPNVDIVKVKGTKLACGVKVEFGDDYGAWVGYGFEMLRGILAAKYGDCIETKNWEGRQKYVWRLPYGEVSITRGKEAAVVSFLDYSALKKEFPNLFKML